MPHNKNQHFVPKVYLKRFANAGNERAISLYNFRSDLYVEAAPLRGQCSSSYLYGEDLKLEKLLSGLEGDFGSASSTLIDRGSTRLSPDDVEHIRLFLVIQMFRTEQAIEKTRQQFEMMHDLMFHDIEDAPDQGDMSDRGLVLRNIRLALRFYHGLTDLRILTLQNDSDVPFITSDAPAVATNRLFLQKFKSDNFGLGQSGLILYLPLSHSTAVIFYDHDVYVPFGDAKGLLHLRSSRDARALNRLIALEARQNIYFRGDRVNIEKFVQETRANYAPRWHSAAVYAPDPEGSDPTLYSQVPDDHRQEGSMLYVSSVHYPDPQEWLSGLRFRSRMIGYTNGSAVGYVRKHTAAQDGQPVRKIHLRGAAPPPGPSRNPDLRWRNRTSP
jgi:hypothetical protein